MQRSSKFPSVKIPRLSNQEDSQKYKKVSTAQKLLPIGYEVDVALHTDTNNFAPNKYRGVFNSSGLAVYKGSTQEIIATESKLRV